jgi:6-pyruvoyl-tetrahydropterin synthase
MIAEYSELDAIVAPILRKVDHNCLNDITENPTVEWLVQWIAASVEDTLALRVERKLNLLWVQAEEDSRSFARWEP